MIREIPAVFICIFSFLETVHAAERVLYVADKTGLSLARSRTTNVL
jgi:hypothetical protein